MFNGSMYKLITLRSVVPLLFSLMACTFYIPNFSLSIKILLQKNGLFIRGSTQMVKSLEVYGLFKCKEILWSGLQYNTVFFQVSFFSGWEEVLRASLFYIEHIPLHISLLLGSSSKVKNEICSMVNSSLEWRVLIAPFVTQMVSDSRRLSEWYYFRGFCPFTLGRMKPSHPVEVLLAWSSWAAACLFHSPACFLSRSC